MSFEIIQFGTGTHHRMISEEILMESAVGKWGTMGSQKYIGPLQEWSSGRDQGQLHRPVSEGRLLRGYLGCFRGVLKLLNLCRGTSAGEWLRWPFKLLHCSRRAPAWQGFFLCHCCQVLLHRVLIEGRAGLLKRGVEQR